MSAECFLRRAALAALAVLTVALTAGDARSQTATVRPVTIAWDANAESVAGYIVHVGTAPRDYRETYDVGDQTSFTYPNAVAGRRYYFAVSAYWEGPIQGPLSPEVSVVGTAVSQARVNASRPDRQLACLASTPTECATRRLRAHGLGPITALADAGDGRLFVLESGVHVRVVAANALVDGAALSADDANTRFTDLVVDPAFPNTGYVFIGVAAARRDGTRAFSIVRYRAVENGLGEGAVVVSGLMLTGTAEAPFTVDDTGRIYVAMPAGDGTGREPYAGYILRFNADGSVPARSRGMSPVMAHGYAVPLALDWEGDDLWVVGVDPKWPHEVARLALDASSEGPWPQTPVPSRLALDSTEGLHRHAFDRGHRTRGVDSIAVIAFLDSPHGLHRVYVRARDEAAPIETIAWPEDEMLVAVSVGLRQEIYVAVQSVNGGFAIVELASAMKN